MICKISLLLGSIFMAASCAFADPLITIRELEPATPIKPALIQTSLTPELLNRYCHLVLLSEQNLNSRTYMSAPHQAASKKIRFAVGSQLLITEPQEFGEWIVTTVVDDRSGALEYRIPKDAAKDVLCESGAYVLGDKPLVVRDLTLFQDRNLQIEACTLPQGSFDGTIHTDLINDVNATIFDGPTIQTLCAVDTAYGAFHSPIIRPRSRS